MTEIADDQTRSQPELVDQVLRDHLDELTPRAIEDHLRVYQTPADAHVSPLDVSPVNQDAFDDTLSISSAESELKPRSSDGEGVALQSPNVMAPPPLPMIQDLDAVSTFASYSIGAHRGVDPVSAFPPISSSPVFDGSSQPHPLPSMMHALLNPATLSAGLHGSASSPLSDVLSPLSEIESPVMSSLMAAAIRSVARVPESVHSSEDMNSAQGDDTVAEDDGDENLAQVKSASSLRRAALVLIVCRE
jgi:hypothetical protein